MTISEKVQPEKLSASILLRLDGRLIFPLKMSILLLAKYIGEPFEPFPDIIKITKSPKAGVMEVEPEPASFKGILEAKPVQLMKVEGVTKKSAALIAMIAPLARVWERTCMQNQDRIGNSREAEAYCKSLLMGERTERFYVIALNAQCKVLGVKKISEGSLSEVSAYPRMVAETALNYNAHSVLLAHNHPGGTCSPSMEDIQSTIQLQRMLNAMGILVLDHIVVAGSNTYSMIQHGDIDYRMRKSA